MLQKLYVPVTKHDGICHTSASLVSKLMTPQHLSQLCQANPRARLRYISIQLHTKNIRFQKLDTQWAWWDFCSFLYIHKVSAEVEYNTEEIHVVSPHRSWTHDTNSTLYGGNF